MAARYRRGQRGVSSMASGFEAGAKFAAPITKSWDEEDARKEKIKMLQMARAQRVADGIALMKMKREMDAQDPYRQALTQLAQKKLEGLGGNDGVPTPPSIDFTPEEQHAAYMEAQQKRRSEAGLPLMDPGAPTPMEQPMVASGGKSSTSRNVPRGTNSSEGLVEVTHTVDKDGPKTSYKTKVTPDKLPQVWNTIDQMTSQRGHAAGEKMDRALHENDPLADYPVAGNALGMMKQGGTLADREASAVAGQAGAVPAPAGNVAPPEAVDYLRQNPQLADEFNAKYGAGAADEYLKTEEAASE